MPISNCLKAEVTEKSLHAARSFILPPLLGWLLLSKSFYHAWLYIRIERDRGATKPGVSSLSLAQPSLALFSVAVLAQLSLP